MEVITIESEAFKQIMERLDRLEESLQNAYKPSEKQWLNNKEFCEYLGISKRTAQNYRDTGVIPFSQIGSKIYYRLIDIHMLLTSRKWVPLIIFQFEKGVLASHFREILFSLFSKLFDWIWKPEIFVSEKQLMTVASHVWNSECQILLAVDNV